MSLRIHLVSTILCLAMMPFNSYYQTTLTDFTSLWEGRRQRGGNKGKGKESEEGRVNGQVIRSPQLWPTTVTPLTSLTSDVMNVSHVLLYFQSFAYPPSNTRWLSVFSSAPDSRKEGLLLWLPSWGYCRLHSEQPHSEWHWACVDSGQGKKASLVPEEVL